MPAELHQPATAAPPAQGAMASANAAPSASNDQNRDIFEFFELPRELRDLIYGYAVDEKSALQFADTEFQLRCCDAPCVNFLLVCRQVKLEYMETSNKFGPTLEIFDLLQAVADPSDIKSLPEPMLLTTSLHLRLTSDLDVQGNNEMTSHMHWVAKFLPMLPRLDRLAVTVLCPVKGAFGTAEMAHHLAPWLRLPHFKQIEVYDTRKEIYSLSDIMAYENLMDRKLLSMRWSEEGQKWEDSHGKDLVLEEWKEFDDDDDETGNGDGYKNEQGEGV
ncbi:unnamed protein product [Zymoseptoria tritici ST99CH_1A5]|uniref:F-box domain-containing protein n=3 Tax=Zymoseptoria tritici TaxID=1047171 RepID=A0A1X7RU31_ZYMT9|nr:unnamed protein product [Zymoseptoria tritici ST99CH_3D7]SMR52862.1 unnamed protein product [Zymoseptoria tritici ST99CH_1E4]SMR54251.1 unnamed protein product [Zymoseptoria tritici ST99CH_3D1]SMY24605.1 unnamed protein product [Zymoseptoria tritici ST99CH_1A5]